MAFSLIAHTEKTGGNTTPNIDTTGATLIVICIAADNATAPTDSKGNTWTALTTSQVSASSTRSTLFYCVNPNVGSGHNFTQSASYGAIFVSAWSGNAASPFDQENGNTTTSGTSLTPGSITPTENSELVIVGICVGKTNSSPSINGGFTISDSIDGVTDVNYGGGMAYLIQTTATAANPTYSWTGAGEAAYRIASFKAAGVSPSASMSPSASLSPSSSPSRSQSPSASLSPSSSSSASQSPSASLSPSSSASASQSPSASLSPSSSASASQSPSASLSPSSSASASQSPSASLSPSSSSSASLSPSSSASPSAGAAPMVKVWMGSSWVDKPLKFWDGSSWM